MSTAHYTLSGREAGDIATHARYLLRRRVITPFQHALLDVMLWGARKRYAHRAPEGLGQNGRARAQRRRGGDQAA
jgi:hypothetical protein